MKKSNQLFMNYLLSIGFVLLIVIFLLSIVLISRLVLSNPTSTINAHLKNSSNILNDISEVESLTKSTNNSQITNILNEDFLRLNYNNFNVSKPYIINLNKNSSIFTFYINGEIAKSGNIYYKKIQNYSDISKGDVVFYQNTTGLVLDIKNSQVNILDSSKSIKTINISKIEGIVFFKND